MNIIRVGSQLVQAQIGHLILHSLCWVELGETREGPRCWPPGLPGGSSTSALANRAGGRNIAVSWLGWVSSGWGFHAGIALLLRFPPWEQRPLPWLPLLLGFFWLGRTLRFLFARVLSCLFQELIRNKYRFHEIRVKNPSQRCFVCQQMASVDKIQVLRIPLLM